MKNRIRVRFAPSPTGLLHLGNIRIALMNYLLAQKYNGKFVLRIEDTDAERNDYETVAKIISNLKWLRLSYDEGPDAAGGYGPYMQSERSKIYQEFLDQLAVSQKIYRCFCTSEILERKRAEQVAAGNPPRYDRTCMSLSGDKIKQKLVAGRPFVWRFKINQDQVLDIQTISGKPYRFEMKNFSDFTLTRSDGSYTFIFTNFVDDWKMGITHVIRGEDHLSNTAMQAALFDAFAVQPPVFCHLPMICDSDGKKLSKRDSGFSIDDLKSEGFLPQAICNYLAIIGTSFDQEVQDLNQLAASVNFDAVSRSGAIRYDQDKLTWLNHKWINRLPLHEVLHQFRIFLAAADKDDAKNPLKIAKNEKLISLLDKIRSAIKTLADIGPTLSFCFAEPKTSRDEVESKFGKEQTNKIIDLLKDLLAKTDNPAVAASQLKVQTAAADLTTKDVMSTLRYILTGNWRGPSIKDILEMLEIRQVCARISSF